MIAIFGRRGLVAETGILLPFVVMLGIIGLLAPTFLNAGNVLQVLRQASIVGVMVIGMTFVLVAGRVDLSIGSLLSLVTMITIDLHERVGPLVAILVALGTGLAVGLINGVLVAFFRLNALIATLGMLSLLQGLTMIYSSGQDLSIADPSRTWFAVIGRGQCLGIPVPVVILAVIGAAAAFLLHASVYGRRVFAVGGNEATSLYSGLRTSWLIASTYLLSGLATAVGALIMASRVMGAQTNTGAGYEFDVIAAAALGGISLTGGSGSILGSVVGVVVLAFLQNGLLQIGFPYYTQWIVTWLVIVAALWSDGAARRGRVLA